jgi:hypothetical protein
MTVEATFPNPDGRITPGMFGSAQILLAATETAVFAPADAVFRVADADAMYVIEDNRARLRVVQLGETQSGVVRVDAGLLEGAIVVTSNLDKLSDGALVQVTEASGPVGRTERAR